MEKLFNLGNGMYISGIINVVKMTSENGGNCPTGKADLELNGGAGSITIAYWKANGQKQEAITLPGYQKTNKNFAEGDVQLNLAPMDVKKLTNMVKDAIANTTVEKVLKAKTDKDETAVNNKKKM